MMAAVESGSPEQLPASVGSPPCPEVTRENPLENLMERLRTKASHYKQWGETAKAIRMAVADKRHVIDSVERSQLQKCLDVIQKNIKVTSLQSMVERLDSITRQQGLKFTFGPTNTECYISSDMFYVEILLEQTGEVKDVKIAHHGEPSTCPELTKVLRGGNFMEFTKHLEGLSAIYQLNADKKQKTKAYLALQALEIDLSMLAQLQSSINDPSNLVHKSPVGILQQRQGGFSLKLTYFISPYDLLDAETKSSIPLTVDAVIEKGLGHSVTVCIESSPAHKLQTVSLISVSKTPEGKSLPSFAALSNLNSTTLPASFVLKLPQPIPMASSIVKKIQGVTKITDSIDMSTSQPLLSLIANDTSKGKLQCLPDTPLFVTLPDQHHCYYISSSPEIQGVLVSSIPFTHPTHVPQILVFLRQQMLFNTVISSCVRPESKQDAESPLMFEVVAYSTSHIVVSFEHPLEESLASVELDLKDITNVKCKIYTLSSDATICSDEFASKVMQRCLSIPVTMRAVIRKSQGQRQQMRSSNQGDMYCASVTGGGSVPYLSQLPNYGGSLSNGSSFSGGDFSNLASRMCNKPSDMSELGSSFVKGVSVNQTPEPEAYGNSALTTQSQHLQGFDQPAVSPHAAITTTSSSHTDMYGMSADPSAGSNNKNPMLENLLSQSGNSANQLQYQQSKHANTMLMSMLSDVPSANPSSSSFPFLGQSANNSTVPTGCNNGKSRKQRKRKATPDGRSPGSSTGRSPKRKLSEDDCLRDQPTPDAESVGSPMSFDISSSSSMPATLPSSSADQSHLNQAMASLSTFIKTEPPSHGYPQRSASTDSYLSHENFPSQQLLADSHSRLSEGATPTSPELFSNVGTKSQYFNADNSLEFNPEFLPASEPAYSESAAEGSDIDLDDEDVNSLNLDINAASASPSKLILSNKQSKKSKKAKDGIECRSTSSDVSSAKSLQDENSSDDSSLDESSHKSCSEAENSQSEDSSTSFSKANQNTSSQPLIIGTSLKIAKSGDGLKVSKSELKVKQREGRRSTSAGDGTEGTWGKRKGDSKKERKRRRAESADSISDRSPVRSFHLNIDSSLMPPPSSSSETACSVASSDCQSVRPLTLNVKTSSTVSSSTSPSRSRSPVQPKKAASTTNTSSSNSPSRSSSASKSSSEKSGTKTSSPSSGSLPTVKVSSSESDANSSSSSSTKVTLSTSLKLQGKHKTGNNSKSSSSVTGTSVSSSHTSGRSSPNKTKSATLKLKNLGLPNLPSSTTITPITSKQTSSSPTSNPASLPTMSSSSVSIIPSSAPLSPTGKNSSNNSKVGKAALRSRKGTLSAVIDKLRVTASNAQIVPSAGMENSKIDAGASRIDNSSERRESKSDKRGDLKEAREGSNSKTSEGKTKYSSSDQFTVKQSSQGIKLTVTKTRSSDGSSKSGKSKIQSSKTSVSSSSTVNANLVKATSSSGGSVISKSGSSSPVPKKSASLTSSTSTTTSCSAPKASPLGSNVAKSVANPPQKSVSPANTPGATSPRISSSSGTSSKVLSKQVSSSVQGKVSTSGSKVFDKSEKKSVSALDHKSITSSETRDKISSGALNMVTNLMPPPPSSKSFSDISRSSGSGNTPKRTEGSPVRHSPRHTPTRDNVVDESDGERAFRLLLAQTKMESQNGAEQTVPSCKASDLVTGAIDYGKSEPMSVKLEPDDKTQRVSSSTDIKPVNIPRTSMKTNQEIVSVLEETMSNATDNKLAVQAEVSSSSKHDSLVVTNLVTSSEELNKIGPYNKPIKQTKRSNTHSDDDSSPEDGLVIDYLDAPRHPKSPDKKMSWTSPAVQLNALEDKNERAEPSPGAFIKSPYQPSPLKSPAQVITPPSNHSISSSLSRPSPCIIDDDLMDEALMTIGKEMETKFLRVTLSHKCPPVIVPSIYFEIQRSEFTFTC